MSRLCFAVARGAVAAGALLLAAVGAQAGARQDSIDFAARRAALELAAGRAAVAARELAAVAPEAGDRDGLVLLLWAQAEIVSGRAEKARPRLETLVRDGSGWARAQAVAHLVGLAVADSAANDAIATAITTLWAESAHHRSGVDAVHAGPGDLLAARLHHQPDVGARDILERPRSGPAHAVAQLVLAESALARGEVRVALDHFTALAESKDDPFAGWAVDWARLGRARALELLGQHDEARAGLATIERTAHLQQYARWMAAQIAYASGDLALAAALVQSLHLEPWNGSLAAEGALLGAQMQLDRGDFAAAESTAIQLAARLPELFRAEKSGIFLERRLELDGDAWHAAGVRLTLARLAEQGVLRSLPAAMQLPASESTLVLRAPYASDSMAARLVLLAPYRHEVFESEREAAAERAARALGQARVELERLRRARDQARAELTARQELQAAGLALLAEHAQTLDALFERTHMLAGDLDVYCRMLAAQSDAWKQALAGRLAALEATLASLRRASERLEARYPADRSVRVHVDVEAARAELEAARPWVAAFESLHADLAARTAQRVDAILGQLAPQAAGQAVAALLVQLEGLRAGNVALAARLRDIDAAERLAFAAAQRDHDAGAEAWSAARGAAQAHRNAVLAERGSRAEARLAVYLEAADDARASAIFLDALHTKRDDTTRVQALERAAVGLEDFVAAHPGSERAPEMLYRAAEMHLQQAAVQHRVQLAQFLSRGGDAADAPVPVEDYAQAIDVYTRLLARAPGTPRQIDAHFQVGMLFGDIGMPEQSSEHLESFLAASDSTDVRRGRAALRLGDNALAVQQQDKACAAFAIAASSSDPEARAVGLLKLGWTQYELARHGAARQTLRSLLDQAATADSTARARDLEPEALELLSLAFAEDHLASEAADVMDAWGRPHYEFALLCRMAELFTSRAQFDAAIGAYQTLFERHPLHPEVAGAVDEMLRLVELRRGAPAAHALAADFAPHFAPGGAWAHAARTPAKERLRPTWQSRLVEADQHSAQLDSLAQALARPDEAARRMATRLQAAAVFAHREAARDSTHGRANLVQAVALYQHTLAQFPGSEQEATTWLYLGEARYALGQHVEAADAYSKAAQHESADSAIVATAARAELAALDAATAGDAGYLERYASSVELFLGLRPRDGAGLVALERVGDLAFRAGRFELAEAAYGDLAVRTPDAKRRASALKVVGDTSWQRERYREAAERYERALQGARSARSDSLESVLAVLIPGALYRAAEAENAAELFERVGREHPGFEFADQALYRAAQLRVQEGDPARAVEDYTRLIDAYTQSALHADAMLQRAQLREASDAPRVAAAAYEEFATRHAAHAQALAARLRAADLYETSKDATAADAALARILQQVHPEGQAPGDSSLAASLWLRRARLSSTLTGKAPHYERALACRAGLTDIDRAEAHFQLAELVRPKYARLTLGQPLSDSLPKKQAALGELLHGYAASLEANVEPWHAASCLRVGEALIELGEALRNSNAPAELEGDDLYSYKETLGLKAQELEDRAVLSWSQGLRSARATSHEDEWSAALRTRLYALLAHRVPTQPAPLFVLAPSRN